MHALALRSSQGWYAGFRRVETQRVSLQRGLRELDFYILCELSSGFIGRRNKGTPGHSERIGRTKPEKLYHL